MQQTEYKLKQETLINHKDTCKSYKEVNFSKDSKIYLIDYELEAKISEDNKILNIKTKRNLIDQDSNTNTKLSKTILKRTTKDFKLQNTSKSTKTLKTDIYNLKNEILNDKELFNELIKTNNQSINNAIQAASIISQFKPKNLNYNVKGPKDYFFNFNAVSIKFGGETIKNKPESLSFDSPIKNTLKNENSKLENFEIEEAFAYTRANTESNISETNTLSEIAQNWNLLNSVVLLERLNKSNPSSRRVSIDLSDKKLSPKPNRGWLRNLRNYFNLFGNTNDSS